MRLKFIKDGNDNISVKITNEIDGEIKEDDFNYVTLIDNLYKKCIFEDPEFIGDIGEYEQEKIKEMILKLNESVVTNE